jgi:hypothetical protein
VSGCRQIQSNPPGSGRGARRPRKVELRQVKESVTVSTC